MVVAADGHDANVIGNLFDVEFLRKLERFEILARKIFRGQLRGEHLTRRRGRGIEVSDFRRYHPGDDFRYIDWNIYSRLDRLFVKLHASEDDLSLHVLIDASSSMAFGTPGKFDIARRVAAALAYIGLCNTERVSISAFSEAIGPELLALKGRGQMKSVLDFLTGLECGGSTVPAGSLLGVGARRGAPGLAVVLSDFIGPGDVASWLDPLRHRGHEVVAIQLLAEEELEPPLDGALSLVDAEDGSSLRITIDERLRAIYRRRLGERLQALEEQCRRGGVEYLRASTAVPVDDLILGYLRQGGHFR